MTQQETATGKIGPNGVEIPEKVLLEWGPGVFLVGLFLWVLFKYGVKVVIETYIKVWGEVEKFKIHASVRTKELDQKVQGKKGAKSGTGKGEARGAAEKIKEQGVKNRFRNDDKK